VTFEDNFEGTSSTLDAEKWFNVVNGEINDLCGTVSSKSKNSLVFSGFGARGAEIKEISAIYGGQLQFWLKMGEKVENPDLAICKPAYGGNVHVYYRTNDLESWTQFAVLETWNYDSTAFRYVQLEIPLNARSSSISFKIQQEHFKDMYEHWAIDDVKFLSYFDQSWFDSTDFKKHINGDRKVLEEIKCCLKSVQCSLSKERQGQIDCKIYTEGRRIPRPIYGTYQILIISAILQIFKIIYSTTKISIFGEWSKINFPIKNAKIYAKSSNDLEMRFELEEVNKLQAWVAFYFIVHFWVIFVLNYYSFEKFSVFEQFTIFGRVQNFRMGSYLLQFIATALDSYGVFYVAKYVFCFFESAPKVTLNPTALGGGYIQIGKSVWNLENVKEIQKFTKSDAIFATVLHILGAFPLSSYSLLLENLYISYQAKRIFLPFLGVFSVMRAWAGPTYIMKIISTLKWMTTLNLYKRDEIGRTLKGSNWKFMTFYSCVACFVSAYVLSLLLGFTYPLLFSLGALVFGFIYGILISVFLKLPIIPKYRITALESGVRLNFYRQVFCPCDARFNHCSRMFSYNETHVLFLKNSEKFREILEGEFDVE